MSDPDVICEERGACGILTLNRPDALNALTLGMVHDIARALDAWERNSTITRIAIQARGGKAFCAGGDIRQLYDQGKAGRYDEQLGFWRDEYRLNRRIKRYPKPYVALVDGIVMGGGVGIALHGSRRIAGDRFSFAMPEVGIGFFPDIGATYFLPRLPGRIGAYLALNGARADAGDAVALGLATDYVPSARFEPLLSRLAAGEDVPAAIAAERRPPPPSKLLGEQVVIDRCFAGTTLDAILAEIEAAAAAGSGFAAKAANTIKAKSPTSLAIALRQMQTGGGLDFEEAMRTEFRIVARVARGHDFYEGIRATLIDRDMRPGWKPEKIEMLEPARIDLYFAPLTQGELDFPAAVVPA